MASGLYIDRDGFEDFYLDLDDVDEAAKGGNGGEGSVCSLQEYHSMVK